ncbi:hypothetical protein [Natranaerofaba carboxydovora]|uniref:homocitrate synthase/isopropylmalate synthase family protein n=1 Tax=Natranaerofaba carboxydovora TaxID=2742683 RepID=UPI001F136867|nr:hypothetical protein [Natranaerofaba carboxydovora]UMZ72742.1 Citrate (Re)-synthase [Natranaerofaba carboxydovora]
MKEKKNRIYILDVTNRDGVQTANVVLSKFQRTMVNHYLGEMGIYQSEFGFPTLKHEQNYVEANLDLAKKGVMNNMILEGWVRAVPEDVKKALELTNIEHINLSIPTSQIMVKSKFGAQTEGNDIIKMMTEAVSLAKEYGIKTIGVNAEDASRTKVKGNNSNFDEDFLLHFAREAKKHGADRIRYCDTLGYERTPSIYESVKRLAGEVQLPIELHCHNDTGYAVANSVEGAMGAIDAGVDAYINTTVNGIGERAGNADLVAVILAIKHACGLEEQDILDPNIDLTKAWKLCNYTANAFGIPIPMNKIGIGSNMYSHESGIHADGMLKDRRNYELYSPEDLGINESNQIKPVKSNISTGEFGGIKGLKHLYESMGVQIDNEREVLKLVQYANAHNQQPLTEEELKFIAKYPAQVADILSLSPKDHSLVS